VGIKDNSILVFIGFSNGAVERVFRMAADGKEVHTESSRVLLPDYYRAGNSSAVKKF
jgi:hypothetical protein